MLVEHVASSPPEHLERMDNSVGLPRVATCASITQCRAAGASPLPALRHRVFWANFAVQPLDDTKFGQPRADDILEGGARAHRSMLNCITARGQSNGLNFSVRDLLIPGQVRDLCSLLVQASPESPRLRFAPSRYVICSSRGQFRGSPRAWDPHWTLLSPRRCCILQVIIRAGDVPCARAAVRPDAAHGCDHLTREKNDPQIRCLRPIQAPVVHSRRGFSPRGNCIPKRVGATSMVHRLGSDFTLHRRDSRLASRHGAPMTTVRNWKMQWVASDWHVPREPVNLNAPLATLACGSTRCLALLVRVCGILYLGQSSYAVASMPPPIGTDMSRVASGDWYVCVGR